MLVTLSRHIIDQQRKFPQTSGKFIELLLQIAMAAKMVAYEVRKASILDVLGALGKATPTLEDSQKLDTFARQTFVKALEPSGLLCVMWYEEAENVIHISPQFPTGPYVLNFDPLDGASNIDVNVSVGSIFSIHRQLSKGEKGNDKDCLQPGRKQVCAGYIIYSTSTMLVYTAGSGVYGFTLHPGIGEFILTHPEMKFPQVKKNRNIFSVNVGNYPYWEALTKRYVDAVMHPTAKNQKIYKYRYTGSLVADFHRNLLQGGLFLYPADYKKDPKKLDAKLHLLVEASPLALIAEQAGGKASTGSENILDVQPVSLNQRTPLVIGSKEDVEHYENFIRENARTLFSFPKE
jgi:fructose-1,6-bisphosphatase I